MGEFHVGERKAIDYEDRRIVVILDNNHSKLRAKTIAYSVTIGEVDDVAEMRGIVSRLWEEFIFFFLPTSLFLYSFACLSVICLFLYLFLLPMP